MKRRDVIIVALPGDKPRPALIVQSDRLTMSESVLVCPFTSGLNFSSPHRVVVLPDLSNGLDSASVLMTEKMQAIRRKKCGQVVGSVSISDMTAIETQLAFILGFGTTAEG